MFERSSNEDGFSLVLVIIFIAVVGVLLASYVSSAIFNINFTGKQIDKTKAYFAAQSGIQHLKSDLNNYYNNYSLGETVLGNKNISYGDNNASYTVTITDESSNEKVFKSVGNYNGSESEIFYTVSINTGLNDFGVFTAKLLEIGGSAEVNDGDVYVEMDEEDVEGFENYINNGLIFTKDDGFSFDFPLDSESFEEDNFDQSFGKIKKDETITVDDGEKIYIDEVDISGNRDFIINNSTTEEANVDIFVENGFNISGNAEFEVAENINVNLYISDFFELNGGGNSYTMNALGDSTIVTYIHPDISEIRLSGNIDGNLLFYAPKTFFKLTGSAVINGAIIADKIDSTGNFEINYDGNLDKLKDVFNNDVFGGGVNVSTVWSN